MLLRGRREFASLEEYRAFVQQIIDAVNANRRERFAAKQVALQELLGLSFFRNRAVDFAQGVISLGWRRGG